MIVGEHDFVARERVVLFRFCTRYSIQLFVLYTSQLFAGFILNVHALRIRLQWWYIDVCCTCRMCLERRDVEPKAEGPSMDTLVVQAASYSARLPHP